MEEKIIENGKYKLHYIYTDNYKTNVMRICFKHDLTKESITENEILAGVLSNSTGKYKTLRDYVLEKENLYNVKCGWSSVTSGKYMLFEGSIRYISETYTEEGMDASSIRFLLDSFFYPNVKNKSFNKEAFDLEKHNYLEYLEGKNDNPSRYAAKRFNEIMGKNTPMEYDRSGDADILKKIDNKTLYQTYLSILPKSTINIFFVGNTPLDKIVSILDEYPFLEKENKGGNHLSPIVKKDFEEVKEKRDFKQSKLLMGYTIDNLDEYELKYVLPVYSFILGGGCDSLLFKEIREKHSLCYSVYSNYYPIYSILVIGAGIDAKNYKKTISLVKKLVDKMKKGDFSEEEIDKVKINYISAFEEFFDDPRDVLKIYESHEYLNYDLIEERKENMQKVTKDMVVKVASRIELKTIYFLEGEECD